MKPIKLEMEAFLPYLKKQTIDFNALDKYGLFLIHGKTGSGKTSILDGITYALFGQSSSGERGDSVNMRSKFAGQNENTKVSFEFCVHNKFYKFTREIKEHIKRSGEKEYQVSQNAFYLNEKDEYIPFFENPKLKDVKEKAEEILGLNFEQFKQVVILPQGKFEKFLVAGSEDKENILATLFNAQYIENITKWLWDKSIELKREKEKAESYVKGSLSQYNCENCEQLMQIVNGLQEEKSKVSTHAKTQEEVFIKVQSEYNLAKTVMEKFNAYDELCKEKVMLEKMQSEMEELKNRMQKAYAAKSIIPVRNNASNLGKILKQRKADFQSKMQNTSVLNEQHKKNIVRLFACYSGKQAEYEKIKAAKTQVQDLISKYEEKYKKVFDKYMNDCAFVLSENLQDGEPCLVCGSTTHTKKAQKSANNYTINDVKKAQSDIDSQKKMLADAEKKEEALQKEITLLLSEKQKYENLNQPQPINEDASKVILSINSSLSEYKNAQKIEELALKECENATVAFDDAMNEYKELCKKSGFENDNDFISSCIEDSLIKANEEKIQNYFVKCEVNQNRIQQLKQELTLLEKPDFAVLEDKYKNALKNKQLWEKQLADICAKIDIMQKAYKQIFDMETKLKEKTQEYVELDSFAKLLRGNNGVGLKRYVLGVMLICIANEANRLLKLVHGGRYQIQKKDEYSGKAKKVGLELEIFDIYSGEFRNVESLSGGEKFLVALALSFGLSSVVQMQQGGIVIDSMFIDEGFGSLDPSSIEDALNILAEVKGSQKLIGIISHVQMLKESIECRLEVQKEMTGSSITFLG